MTTSTRGRPTGNESFILEVSSAMTDSLASKARRVFTHTRLVTAVQGVGAVAVGLAVIAWPGASLIALVLLFGVYAAADGVLSVLQSLAEHDGASLLRGLVSLTVAGAALGWRDASAVVLVYIVAAWVIGMAVVRARHAVTSRQAWLVLLALPSVAGGVSALFAPVAGASSVLMDIAVFQIINGLGTLGLAVRRRS